MLARYFIDRPVFAGVAAIIVVIAGLVAAAILPLAQYPDIVPPTVVVSTNYPGASAETIARTVAAPDRGAAFRASKDLALLQFVRCIERHAHDHRRPSRPAPISIRRSSTSTIACSSRCRACRKKYAATAFSCRNARTSCCCSLRCLPRRQPHDTLACRTTPRFQHRRGDQARAGRRPI